MGQNEMPHLSEELKKRIGLIKRDQGDLLFHFTHKPGSHVSIEKGSLKMTFPDSAYGALSKILWEEKLIGSNTWIKDGCKCICFTESPIAELAALFSLNKIAVNENERPRYEPYGVAVTKKWLYSKGGRPVIYDSLDVYEKLPADLKYRHIQYDPSKNIDYTWEREWRVTAEELKLDPAQTLVIVPDAATAFDIVYGHSEEVPDIDWFHPEDPPMGSYHEPKWLAVSLDLFGVAELTDE